MRCGVAAALPPAEHFHCLDICTGTYYRENETCVKTDMEVASGKIPQAKCQADAEEILRIIKVKADPLPDLFEVVEGGVAVEKPRSGGLCDVAPKDKIRAQDGKKLSPAGPVMLLQRGEPLKSAAQSRTTPTAMLTGSCGHAF